MDLTNELRRAVSTGKVYFGAEQARYAIGQKEAKLIIVASSPAPGTENDPVLSKFAKRFNFPGNNMELGAACGKPFSVSVLTVVQEGSSRILDLTPA